MEMETLLQSRAPPLLAHIAAGGPHIAKLDIFGKCVPNMIYLVSATPCAWVQGIGASIMLIT